MGLSLVHRYMDFDNFTLSSEIERVYNILKKYDSGSLYLWGKCGSGKTHLAVSLIKKFNGYFKSVPELLLDIRASFNTVHSGNTTEKSIIDYYSKLDLLCLDDLGAEKVTDYSLQTLYLIIDRRMRELKNTIFTSNLSLSELSIKLNDRISSRIAGMGRIIKLESKDQRIHNRFLLEKRIQDNFEKSKILRKKRLEENKIKELEISGISEKEKLEFAEQRKKDIQELKTKISNLAKEKDINNILKL